jgi:hypothetical protein
MIADDTVLNVNFPAIQLLDDAQGFAERMLQNSAQSARDARHSSAAHEFDLACHCTARGVPRRLLLASDQVHSAASTA